MNIESMNEYVGCFRFYVSDSGFKRDVTAFRESLPQNANNILPLRDITEKLIEGLTQMKSGDFANAAEKLLPDIQHFSPSEFLLELTSLRDDKESDLVTYHSLLSQILARLAAELDRDSDAVERIATFITPYVAASRSELGNSSSAIFSVIFKDKKTITGFREFSRTIASWNRMLQLYHQLLVNEPPADIEIIEVQNGSIDFVLSLDAKVAFNLADLFRVGFIAYAAYLAQKTLMLPIVEGYFGSKKLLELDKQRDEALLENIEVAISEQAKIQHENGGAKPENPEKVIEQVTKVITSHIVRGNDAKLLALPPSGGSAKDSDGNTVKKSLSDASTKARTAALGLPESYFTQMLLTYGEIDDADNQSTSKKTPIVSTKKEQRPET